MLFRSEEYGFINKVLIGSSIFFFLGTIDDLFKISPYLRLFVEFITILILTYKGLIFSRFDFLPFDTTKTIELKNNLSIFANLIWIAGITNAINWLDGMDGLAASYAALVSIGISIISISFNHVDIFLIAVLTTSCCLAFLKYNLNPSSILMGDGGSYLLGFLLAVMSLLSSFNKNDVLHLHLPALLLALSILDMIFVIAKRLLSKRSPFYPDRQHIQHRILNLGLTENKTLSFISILTLFPITLAFIFIDKLLAINLLIFIFIYSVYFFWKNKKFLIKNKNHL